MAGKTLMDATDAELCNLKRDHFDYGDFSIMTDTRVVWLSEQAMGTERKQHIEIPRHIFNRLIRKYAGLKKGKR